jgi:N-acetylglucosaminyl-diphospho-decaprenol L-rhamnosyltransferase
MAAEQGFKPIIVCNAASTAAALSDNPFALSPGVNTGYGGAAALAANSVDFRTMVVCNDDMTFADGAMNALHSAATRLGTSDQAAIMGYLPLRKPRIVPLPRVCEVVAQISGLSAITDRRKAAHIRRQFQLPPLSQDGDDKLLPENLAFPFACVVITHGAWQQLGGFDARYPLYFEDMDLLARAHQNSSVHVSVALGDCVHSHSASTRTVLPYALPLMSLGANNYLQVHCRLPKAMSGVLITAGLVVRAVCCLPIRPDRVAHLQGIVRSIQPLWSSRPIPLPPW